MTPESYREKDFPIHIEMGDDGPVLDLGEMAGRVNLPDSGCVLVDFEKLDDGTLRVKTVCVPKGEDAEDDEPKDLGEALDRMASEGGTDDDETYEEEED